MIKNYFVTAWRTLSRNKLFSLINLFGLAVSMSVCLLAISIIINQYAIDSSNPLKDRIYRVNTTQTELGRTTNFATTALPVAVELNAITAVEETSTIKNRFSGDANTGDKIIPVSGIYAQANFFKFFNQKLLYGNPDIALVDPYSIILTEKTAERLYSLSESLIGKTIQIGDLGEFTISGILDATSAGSHVDGFEIITSMSTLPMLEEQMKVRNSSTNYRRYYSSYVYCLLKPGVEQNTITPFLNNIVDQHYRYDENRLFKLSLQPLSSINPAMAELSNELNFTMPFMAIIFIAGLSLLIILTATFNYTNLSVAKALSRMKEVGIRKINGAQRKQIFFQFIVESLVVSFTALFMAYGLMQLLIPQFYSLDPNISKFIGLNNGLNVWVMFIGFTVFVGVLAGALPAILLSKINANTILRGAKTVKLLSGVNFRKTLIVIQFALSLIFITTAIILEKQFDFALNYDLGFDRENILNIELQGNDYNVVKTELGKISGVNEIASIGYVMGIGRLYQDWFRNPNMPDSVETAYQPITPNYIAMLHHKIVAGNNFPTVLNDSIESYVILNEKAVVELGLETPDAAIGSIVSVSGDIALQVIGVVEDFHYDRISKPIKSFAFRHVPEDFQVLSLSLNNVEISKTLAALELAWGKIDNVHDIQYQFYNDQIEATYAGYKMLNKVIGFIAFLAIIISVLGLLGMVIYSTQSRLKEVGIRKVLGANVKGLVWLLSRGYMSLLFIAIILAIPITVVVNNLWIQEMAYRAEIGLTDVLSGVSIMLGLGLIIVTSQTILTALRNPTDTLRDE